MIKALWNLSILIYRIRYKILDAKSKNSIIIKGHAWYNERFYIWGFKPTPCILGSFEFKK